MPQVSRKCSRPRAAPTGPSSWPTAASSSRRSPKEIRNEKFTLAEPEEEAQSLQRLRRWHRDLTARDAFGAPEAPQADERLKQCTAVCENYAERVFTGLHRSQKDQE
ncbi:MAG: Chromate resistance protein ChrB [Thermocrispum sp.]